MSTNRTSNYNLNQWVKSDRVLMSEFNADNAKIDAAVKAVDNRVTSLSSTVSGKASQSALNTLQSTVNSHTSAIAKLGDCLLYSTSYVGTGVRDESDPPSLTFPHRPMVVFISTGNYRLTLIRGSNSWLGSSGNGADVSVTWSGNSVSWTSRYDVAWMNGSGTTYSVVALLDAKH